MLAKLRMPKKSEKDNDSNMLIVTKSKKAKTDEEKEHKKAKAKAKPKKLSKKERKLLEKVIEKKDKAKRVSEISLKWRLFRFADHFSGDF